MTGRRILATLATVIGTLGGCSSDANPQGTCDLVGGPETDRATVGAIDYQVIGGFTGQGDGTSLHIQPDGSVTRQTRTHGAEQGQLDQAALGDLVAKVRSAQFPTLCTVYSCAGCGDNYVDQVSVQFGGDVLTVKASQLGDPPDRLREVIGTLQQIVSGPLQ